MRRPVLHLWFFFAPALAVAAATIFLFLFTSVPPLLVLMMGTVPAGLFGCLIWRLRRFFRHTWGFRTLTSRRLALHYAPELEDYRELPGLLPQFESVLDELALMFGTQLRRPLQVFLFHSQNDLCAVFGRPLGGV